ncbi:GNAT family N-acetyltransferase [Streptomyces sp. NPDC015220]|uniref:GNAT family N-acetyltransferase n=1 Tax=Streptomyces sp. NPDC015220 TaxID=3364947 RepID=UPI00370326B6
MPENVTLRGERVFLEPMETGHVPDLTRAASESRDAYGFTLVPADRDSMARYVSAALDDQSTGWALPFVVRDRRRDQIVGSTRFLDLDYWTWPPSWPPGRTTPRPDAIPTVAEIGSTWLSASAQGTGCNTEAKLLMLTHAFDVWGVLRVTLKTDARNGRSRAAIEKIGGRFEGVRRAHARAVDGSVRDTAYYSVLSEEWPDVRGRLRAISSPRRDPEGGHTRAGGGNAPAR